MLFSGVPSFFPVTESTMMYGALRTSHHNPASWLKELIDVRDDGITTAAEEGWRDVGCVDNIKLPHKLPWDWVEEVIFGEIKVLRKHARWRNWVSAMSRPLMMASGYALEASITHNPVPVPRSRI
jgi:hypothetical protein